METMKIDFTDYGELFRSDPAKLPDQELLSMDFILHRAWAMLQAGHKIFDSTTNWDAQDILALHIVVQLEMTRRGFQHAIQDALQEQTLAIVAEDAAEADYANDAEKGVRQALAEGVTEVKALQASYFQRNGRYAGSLFALAEVSVDPRGFLRDMSVLYDLKKLPELGHGTVTEVYTALEFERLASTTGCTAGKIKKRDGNPPASIGILHCVGSLDERHQPYCSQVCCEYALKFGLLAREGLPQVRVVNLYREMVWSGKGFDRVRPELFDPRRPPAASKVTIHGVGPADRTLSMDMIAVGKE